MSPLAADLSDLPRPARTTDDGWAPDPAPRFVHLLADQWQRDNTERGPKQRAHSDARFRHSDAGKCARAVALAALNVPPSDPMDLTGVWNTSLGTLVHDAWQAVIADRYPDAQIEPKVQTINGEGAGHIDAVFPDGTTIAFELKTCGGFAYKMAVGERGTPQGPKLEHQIQAALNGKAVDADEVVIGYLSKEAVSVNAAKRNNLSELGRFCAEWTMTRDEYMPVADAEEARVSGILALLDEGTLPARKIPAADVPSGATIVDPRTGRWELRNQTGQVEDTGSYWGCGYCNFCTLCAGHESGRCDIPEGLS